MIFRAIRRAVRRVANFAKNAVKTVTRGIGDLVTKPLQTVGKILDKLPFGPAIKAFAGKFLNSPLAGMLLGPLAGVGAFIGAAMGTDQLLQAGQTIAGSPAYNMGPPAARNNYLEMMAAQHAHCAFPQAFNVNINVNYNYNMY